MDDVTAFCRLRWACPSGGLTLYGRLADAAVSFLMLEATHPQVWRAWPEPGSPWTWKDGVLETFCVLGPPPSTLAPLRELVLGAVARQHRCKDHRYWQLARRLDDAAFRATLAEAAANQCERTRLRARFVLWLLDHPDHRTDGRGWRRWLRTEGQPLPEHLAHLAIASLRRPADAAAAMAGLAVTEVTAILDSLERGPATQIATLLDRATAAAALAAMDVRRSSQTLRGMDETTAAEILQLIDPAHAAARLPGRSRPRILALMNHDNAVRCLQHMPPAKVAERLRFLDPEQTAALRTSLNADPQ